MPEIKIFDPVMCCSTGVCGPDGDDELAQFASTLEWAKKNGVDVNRFNLGHHPGEFAQNATIKQLIESDGVDVLPVVMIDSDVVSKRDYPTRSALAGKLGIEGEQDAVTIDPGPCCGPGEETAKSDSCC